MTEEDRRFKLWCTSCKRFHVMKMRSCPSCGVYKTPQPVSESVYEKCHYLHYECDGCDAYRDHLR